MKSRKSAKTVKTLARRYTLEGKTVSKLEFLKGIEAGKSGSDTFVLNSGN